MKTRSLISGGGLLYAIIVLFDIYLLTFTFTVMSTVSTSDIIFLFIWIAPPIIYINMLCRGII